MSRSAQILQQLELSHTVTGVELARLHGVGLRTIAKEVSAINHQLGSSGTVRALDGSYRLVVVDPERYRRIRRDLAQAEDSLHEPEARAAHLIAALFRATTPQPLDHLAEQMAVGRTTALGDLTRARELLEGSGLEIIGRPKVGLTLEGPEWFQRVFVLRHLFDRVYAGDPAETGLIGAVNAFADELHLSAFSRGDLLRWSTVALDRIRTGHALQTIPPEFADLASSPANTYASALAVELSERTGTPFTAAEATFLALPIAGMRTPDEVTQVGHLTQQDEIVALIDAIMAAVTAEMDIQVNRDDLLPEFTYHLDSMLNRTRYRIWIDDSTVATIGSEYPVANRMARIAARVIEERTGLRAADPEIAFLTAYFGVFVESRKPARRGHLSIAIVTGTGRVSGRLVEIQLRRILPPTAEYHIVPMDDRAATSDVVATADLVVAAPGARLGAGVPVIELDHIFDRRTLARQLGPLWFTLSFDAQQALDSGLSPIAAALDAEHFFVLDPGTDYLDAVEYMARRLEAAELVEAGFAERLLRREDRSTMRLDPWVAFPHTTLVEENQVVLAVGVIPQPEESDDVRLIVLMGIPANPERGEAMLIAIYEEVIRLAARRDVVDRLSRATSFESFFYSLDTVVNDEEQ